MTKKEITKKTSKKSTGCKKIKIEKQLTINDIIKTINDNIDVCILITRKPIICPKKGKGYSYVISFLGDDFEISKALSEVYSKDEKFKILMSLAAIISN